MAAIRDVYALSREDFLLIGDLLDDNGDGGVSVGEYARNRDAMWRASCNGGNYS